MKAPQYLLLGLTLWSALTACQPDADKLKPDPGTQPVNQADFIRPKGTPEGPLVQKTIGPEGGTLASADNRLTMTIPAGAVKQATQFSIQPITNTLADSVGNSGSAYRLLPEGTTFEKPVTLQMHYDQANLQNTVSQALFLAYQGADGLWKYLPATDLDESGKTLTVQTHHFSDWGVFAEFYLTPEKSHLNPGESTRILLRSTNLANILDSKESTEVLISKVRTLNNPDNIQNWKASVGQLEVAGSKLSAIYTAPATVPAEGLSVQISVDVNNFIPPSRVKRKGATGHAILLATVIVEGETYFRLFNSLGGDDSQLDVIYGAFIPSDDSEGTITATLADGNALVLIIHANRNDYVRSYPYYFSQRDDTPRHKAEIGLKFASNYWVANYEGCKANGESDPHVSPGTVEITGQEKKDGRNYLAGRFSATVYSEKGTCGKGYSREQQTIHGEFKVPFLK